MTDRASYSPLVTGITVPAIASCLCGISIFLSIWAYQLGFSATFPLHVIAGWLALMLLLLSEALRLRLPKPGAAEALLGLFVYWTFVSAIWSRDPGRTWMFIYYYAYCLAIFVVVLRVAQDRKWWACLGWMIIASGFIASCIVLRNATMGVDAELLGDRATIGEINPNFMAYSIAMSVPVALLAFASSSRALPLRVFVVAHLIAATAAIMFSGSRGALGAVLLSLFYFLMVMFRRNLLWPLLALIVIPIIGLALYSQLPESVQLRLAFAFAGGSMGLEQLTGREEVWPEAWRIIQRHFLGGIGVGAFASTNPTQIPAHNALLSIAAETGIVGVILYFGAIGAIFWRVLFRARSSNVRHCGVTLLVTWSIISMTGVWEYSAIIWIVFAWFLAGTKVAQNLVFGTELERIQPRPAARQRKSFLREASNAGD